MNQCSHEGYDDLLLAGGKNSQIDIHLSILTKKALGLGGLSPS